MTDIVRIVMREGEWAYSKFPHPLVTLDYNAEDKLLAVSAPASGVIVYGNSATVLRDAGEVPA
jgi:hypothetical protein